MIPFMLLKKQVSSIGKGVPNTGDSALKVCKHCPFSEMQNRFEECEPTTTVSLHQNFGDENIGPPVDIFHSVLPLLPQSL